MIFINKQCDVCQNLIEDAGAVNMMATHNTIIISKSDLPHDIL